MSTLTGSRSLHASRPVGDSSCSSSPAITQRVVAGHNATQRRVKVRRQRSTCLTLLLAAVLSACGSAGDAGDENDAPEYASTPRKSLESWVAAVRAGDIEMMCRLLGPRPCNKSSVEKNLLPAVRAEMRGLKGKIHYGAIDLGLTEARVVIGVVTGESPDAYAVPIARGKTQWSIDDEELLWDRPSPRAVLLHPNPATVLAQGRTKISVLASADRPGSNYPNAELWIDSRHVDGRIVIPPFDPEGERFDAERVRWVGAARLRPGRHVMVAGVKGDGGVSANAWVLTVR
jgi:hypothetical protein